MSLSLMHCCGRKSTGFFFTRKAPHANPCSGFGVEIKALASRNYGKKASSKRRTSNTRILQHENLPSENFVDSSDNFSEGANGSCISNESSSGGLDGNKSITSDRSAVLKACIVTSGLLLALGALVRQASHVASVEGWAILGASAEVSFGFEIWHIELIIGLVTLISSCRYILLKMWPDFAESSEAANQQILSSLQPLDYVVVAFLPGISEELLFRGALLPLFGLNWKSALVIGAVFGGLHLGTGRRYSFIVWATFVGFAYGLATIISASVVVPIASHSLNNLIGGILWRYTSRPHEKCG